MWRRGRRTAIELGIRWAFALGFPLGIDSRLFPDCVGRVGRCQAGHFTREDLGWPTLVWPSQKYFVRAVCEGHASKRGCITQGDMSLPVRESVVSICRRTLNFVCLPVSTVFLIVFQVITC